MAVERSWRVVYLSLHKARTLSAVTEDQGTLAGLVCLVRGAKRRDLQEITKEVVGIHVLLTRSLFDGGIPRRLLLRVSLAKPTSAPLPC
jgi:hypothetical protein